MRTLRLSLLFLLSLCVRPVFAATYIVPDDRGLVFVSRAIVSGSVTATRVRRGAMGRIETVAAVSVDEWIKGSGDRSIEVVLPGGELGDERMSVPGVTPFTAGERVLLFLSQNGRGDWIPFAFSLGAFRSDGRGLLTRGNEIFGWTVDGTPHVERPRLERAFVDYVRATVRGEEADGTAAGRQRSTTVMPIEPNATYSAGSYSYMPATLPLRRNGAVGEWRVSGKAGDLDAVKAVQVGVAAWTTTTQTFRDTAGTVAAGGDVDGDDGEWRLIVGDPHDEIPEQCCVGIVAGTFLIESGTHVFNGETFRTLTHADILVNDGMSSANFNQDRLNDVVTHEIGHTLGLRHADKNAKNDAGCGGAANCCVNENDYGNCISVMNSLELPNVTGLQKWDRDAISCLYEGRCTPACVAPQFLNTPRGDVIYSGTSAQLSTRVRGTPPLVVQWFAGEKGDTSKFVEAGEWALRVRPEATTKYWVRVTDSCGQIDSDAAELTVVRCPEVALTSASATIVSPGRVHLSALAGAGSRYRWFRSQGPGLPGSLIGLARNITISYAPGTTFWVRVENTCGKAVLSPVLTPSDIPPQSRRRRSRH